MNYYRSFVAVTTIHKDLLEMATNRPECIQISYIGLSMCIKKKKMPSKSA